MIIGTAGHIDHGKTALIHRLTGMNTDRLPEEQRRGLTIELGFAELELDDGQTAGIVDVPGHEHFVRTMVAGATGVDLVLLVVAADDGVMPQTREHLEIIELLGVRAGVVALTKIDLVDAQRVAAVAANIRALLEPGPLHDAPVVPVSAHTGEGVDRLREQLAGTLARLPGRGTAGYFRLAVDRVFTLPGFGPVVTGTVAGGQVRVGNSLRLLPGGQTTRVRGLQHHGRVVETVVAGRRCAINLSGIDKAMLARGMMLCDPRLQRTARTVDAALTVARSRDRAPKNHGPVRLHAGTTEVRARLVWLEPPAPGETALAQLRLDRPVPLLFGDRLVLRDDSRQCTLGGGTVLDPFARRRGAHRPEHLRRLHRLYSARAGEAPEVWLAARGATGWCLHELAEQVAEPPETLEPRLRERQDLWWQTSGGEPWLSTRSAMAALAKKLPDSVAEYLQAHPRETAMAEATLHTAACPDLERTVFRALLERLVAEGVLQKSPDGLRPPGHRQQFSPTELQLAKRVEAELAFRGKPPPKPEALARALGLPAPQLRRFLGELERAGRVVPIARDLYVATADLETWRDAALEQLQQDGQLTLAGFRDRIGAGRELTLRILEYFDHVGITRREGNIRVAGALPAQENARE